MVHIEISQEGMDTLVAQDRVKRASILAGVLIGAAGSSIISSYFVESEVIGDIMWYTSLALLIAAIVPGYRIARALQYVTDYPDEQIGDKKES